MATDWLELDRRHVWHPYTQMRTADPPLPVVAGEAMAYGYEAEDRHFVRVFLGKEKAILNFDDGLDVVKMLMTAYQAAELGKTLKFPPRGIDSFVPQVAKGTWRP